MAATKKGSAKKGSTKKGSTKKASTKKSAAKKGSTKRAPKKNAGLTKLDKRFCSNWQAWQNSMPPGPSTINVVGTCTFPTRGYKAKLTKAVPQGINPVILMLKLTITKPTGPVIPIPQKVEVRFRANAPRKYTNVTILPDGGTIKVQQVV
jgi:hypothetical protein